MNRRNVLGSLAMAGVVSAMGTSPLMAGTRSGPKRPNIVLIVCDDLGYGDLGIMGASAIKTPQIDRMARQGTLFTDFYAAANLCTPSRAGLLTGRYPVRTGLGYQVIMVNDDRHLPLSEVTVAAALKPAGYRSGLFGKWHLGHKGPDWLPTRHGFDRFFGIPYSHDMTPLELVSAQGQGPEQREPAVLEQLQQRFYAEAERFITESAEQPFFVELALSAPHLPARPSPAFAGTSQAGAYGDYVQEVDSIVGRLLAHLAKLGIERDTMVLFTSDNGPWFEGSPGVLRQRKGGGGYDGASRVPLIVRQPGTVPAGRRSAALTSAIDFLPTFCAMAGAGLPSGVTLDGKDALPLLTGRTASSPHEELVLFDNEDPVAIRTQRWKYVATDYYRAKVFDTQDKYPQLYDMTADAAENYSVADRHPEVVAALRARLVAAREQFAPFKSATIPAAFRPASGAR